MYLQSRNNLLNATIAEKERLDTDTRKHREATERESHFLSLSSEAHLQAARALFSVDADEETKQLALRHLASVDAADHSKASSLKQLFALEQSKAAVQAAEHKRQDALVQDRLNEVLRVAMAKTMESRLLDEGFNVDVTVGGPRHTVMKLRYIFVSKVFAHQLSSQGELFESLRKVGFKKLVATDGYDEQWTWNI